MQEERKKKHIQLRDTGWNEITEWMKAWEANEKNQTNKKINKVTMLAMEWAEQNQTK